MYCVLPLCRRCSMEELSVVLLPRQVRDRILMRQVLEVSFEWNNGFMKRVLVGGGIGCCIQTDSRFFLLVPPRLKFHPSGVGETVPKLSQSEEKRYLVHRPATSSRCMGCIHIHIVSTKFRRSRVRDASNSDIYPLSFNGFLNVQTPLLDCD